MSSATARVLVVDDSLTQLHHLADLLTDAGYDVTVATSGEQALAEMEKSAFDCVLLDMTMPGLSGEETCRRIRANEGGRDVAVIMLTAREDRQAVVEALG